VEVSTFCIQEHREPPETGDHYRLAKGASIILTVENVEGRSKSVNVDDLVSLTSSGGFSSITMSLPEVIVRGLGKGVAALEIGSTVSAIPLPVQGDKNPIRLSEIADYTGELRRVAESALENDRANTDATRILAQLMNRVPDRPIVTEKYVKKIWRRLIGFHDIPISETAIAMNKAAFRDCRPKITFGVMSNWRSCIHYHHDLLAAKTTRNVWRALKPGG